MARDKKLYKYEIPLDGKLITSDDPSKIGQNFQSLTNLRYTKTHPKGVGGMTKITSSQLNSTYYKARSGIHYTKNQPSESHVLVEAFNSGEDASRILQNTTAIPSAGNFSGTSLYSPSGTSAGKWALAPDGDVAYCNGEESCLWGGDEREIAGFINYDPDSSFSYDYTDQVRNTLTTDKAVLASTSAGIDANTMLLLHCDGADAGTTFTDSSPTTPHTVTAAGNAQLDTAYKKFGTASGLFDGTGDWLTVPDDADFDFSGGNFAIDCQIRPNSLTADIGIAGQETDVERYWQFYIDTTGAVHLKIYTSPLTAWAAATAKSLYDAVIPTTANGYFYEATVAGTTDAAEPTWPTVVGATVIDNTVTWTCRKVVDMTLSTTSLIGTGAWYHIEVDGDGNNYYIFINGVLKAYVSSTGRIADMFTNPLYLGAVNGGAKPYNGWIDELRLSNTTRHTSSFEVPANAYSDSTTAVSIYIGSLRPLDGIKLYIGTANTSASSMTLFYWDGSWNTVLSLSDGTSAGGKSLAQTGSITFSSTEPSAKVKYIDGVIVYWYKVAISAVSANTSIYYSTVSAPFQTIKDSWDGMSNLIDYFQVYDNSTYKEYTINVRENYYHSADTGSFAELDSLAASGVDYFVCGFSERMMGIIFNFVSGKGNTTAGTILTIKYWNGSSWVSVGSLDDGTFENNTTLAKTGAVTWGAIGIENEFTKNINNDIQLYYYKFEFSKALSADVQVYYITGIRAQKDISAYNFPLSSNDRLFLCNNNKEKKNSVLCSAFGTSSVFNGENSVEYEFGDESELTGGAWIYSQYGSSLYNVTIFFKKNEVWALVGNDPETWTKYKVSSVVGCVAPETIKVIDLGVETKLPNRNIVVWQGANGIYLSDGRSPVSLSEDIKDKFDKKLSTSINTSKIADSTAFWDSDNNCYHWKFASGTSTTLNEEWVLDFKKMAWFEIDRTTDLQLGIEVKDTNGNGYNYGFIDTGYMERLEYGNDFDGQDIIHTLQFGDMVLAEGSIAVETSSEYSCLIAKAKTITSANITITHYGDGKTVGTSWTESPQKSGHRIIYPVKHESLGSYVFHSFKIITTTNNELIGFEPLYFSVLYSVVRDHIRDYR